MENLAALLAGSSTSEPRSQSTPGGAIRLARLAWFAVTVLSVSMALVPASLAGQATFDRTVTVLFRGNQWLSSGTSGATGMDDLSVTLSSASRSAGRSFSSRVFAHNEKADALSFIKAFSDMGCLVLIGHSWGGDEAIELASDSEIPAVDLLIQLDSVGRGDEVLPSSVGRGLNYYQISTGEPQGARHVSGSTDVHVEHRYRVSDADITHMQIDDARFDRTPADYMRLFGSKPDLHAQIAVDLAHACS